MSYYEELSKSCPPRTGTMVGNKDDSYAERLVEARRRCLLKSRLLEARRYELHE
jgi:hypothetical protein